MALITATALAALENQQRRAESLQTRAGHLAGFAGAVIALAAPLATRSLDDVSGMTETIAATAYFIGTAALAAAVVFAVIFVLRPVQHLAISADEVRHYVTDQRFLTQGPEEINFRTLKGVYQALRSHERVNKTKATWLAVTSYCFLGGSRGNRRTGRYTRRQRVMCVDDEKRPPESSGPKEEGAAPPSPAAHPSLADTEAELTPEGRALPDNPDNYESRSEKEN